MQNLFSPLPVLSKVFSLTVFGLLLVLDAYHWAHFTSESAWVSGLVRFYWNDTLFLMILLWNPKGIRIIVSLVLLINLFIELRFLILFHQASGSVPYMLRPVLRSFDFPLIINCFLELLFFTVVMFFVFHRSNTSENELLVEGIGD